VGWLSIISWASDAIDGQMAALVAWVTAGFGTLYADIAGVNSFLGGLGSAVASIFSTLWTWLDNLYVWIQTHIIQKLADLIQRIHDFLERIFGPLLKHLRELIAWYRGLWNTYVKPIYDFLQRLRRVLVLFRLLGFKWAQKLDARIVALETALTNSFLGVLANLNRIADWLNYILDPLGMFQPNVLLGSIAQSVGAIIGIVYGKMNDPGFVSGPSGVTLPANYYDSAVFTQRIQTRLQIGLLPEDTAMLQEIQADLAGMGYSFTLPPLG
jgi:hypothetical protein